MGNFGRVKLGHHHVDDCVIDSSVAPKCYPGGSRATGRRPDSPTGSQQETGARKSEGVLGTTSGACACRAVAAQSGADPRLAHRLPGWRGSEFLSG